MKILFVCNGNINRSPTFEKYFKKHYPQYEIKSSGTHYGYPEKLCEHLLNWADKIYAMDLSQSEYIFKNYKKYWEKVEIIGISDQYDPDDPNLIKLIGFWIKELKNKNE